MKRMVKSWSEFSKGSRAGARNVESKSAGPTEWGGKLLRDKSAWQEHFRTRVKGSKIEGKAEERC